MAQPSKPSSTLSPEETVFGKPVAGFSSTSLFLKPTRVQACGLTSILISIYWAITTVTTVGFGDITPKTDLGRFIASVMMLLGWGTLAVPTGIVASELTAGRMRTRSKSPLAPATGVSQKVICPVRVSVAIMERR